MTEFLYDSLPTSDLRLLAEDEARRFELPNNWQEGRRVRRSFAIDAGHSRDIDDAINYSRLEDGTDIVHVSIAETGTFLHTSVAINALARRLRQTRYTETAIAAPMLPSIISENKLSLLHHAERPVLTFSIPVDVDGRFDTPTIEREIMVADSLSHEELDLIPESNDTPFHHLGRIASSLYFARHGKNATGMEDEEGVVGTREFKKGSFIVQEFMILANLAIGQFFKENNIPGVFRRHEVPTKLRLQLGGTLPDNIEAGFARASYSPWPKKHVGLKSESVVHITSPLRRFADFINHANLSSYLDNRTPVYTEEAIQEFCSVPSKQRKKIFEITLIPEKHKFKIEELGEKIRNETISPEELAYLFFNTKVTEENEVLQTRQEAFAALLNKLGTARSALDIAVQKKWLTPTDGGKKYIDLEGFEFKSPITQKGNKNTEINKILILMSQKAGTPMSYQEIAEIGRRSKILKDGNMFLNKLSHKIRTPLNVRFEEDAEEQSFTCIISMRINDVLHERRSVGKTQNEAKRLAMGIFISELDLIDNPPAPPPKSEFEISRDNANNLRKISREHPKSYPKTLLNVYKNRTGHKPTYTFETHQDEAKRYYATCRATIQNDEGGVIEVNVTASNKTDAEIIAAARLCNELGIGPIFEV